MADADSKREQRGEERGEWISGRTLSDFLFYLVSILVSLDILALVVTAALGNRSYLALSIQIVILVPLIFLFFYFRRKGRKTVGRDFNL